MTGELRGSQYMKYMYTKVLNVRVRTFSLATVGRTVESVSQRGAHVCAELGGDDGEGGPGGPGA